MNDVENKNFLKNNVTSGQEALGETDIEQIMAARPNMSNRDVAAFLRILKKKLPPKPFSLNIIYPKIETFYPQIEAFLPLKSHFMSILCCQKAF